MIIYDLQCQLGHRFEGWFPSADAFNEQQRAGLVSCAECGMTKIEKLPSGFKISKGLSTPAALPAEIQKSEPGGQGQFVNVDPVVFAKAVQKYISENYRNVGHEFTDRAIRMHRGEEEKEPIYGMATQTDEARLDDEGIDFTIIPKLPEEFEN